jgi:hypothetical protein
VLVCGIVGASAALIALRRSYERSVEINCLNMLKQIGLALHNYHSTGSGFPTSRESEHSWRIRLMPYMWSSPQYSAYRFDEPWNSENNFTIDTRPLSGKSGTLSVYGNPYRPVCCNDPEHSVSFLMIVGENGFAHPDRTRTMTEITDGPENTIAVAETSRRDIHWLSPIDFELEDLSFQVNSGHNSISSCHRSGPAVLFCDGAVFRLNPNISPETVKALCTINGGEDASRESLLAKGLLIP